MPWKRKLYPKHWEEEQSLTCKEQANWRCEECGVLDGTFRIGKKGSLYYVRIASAHLDHDPHNPHPRLRALCEVCHNRYDGIMRGQNARRTHYRKIYESLIEAGQLGFTWVI